MNTKSERSQTLENNLALIYLRVSTDDQEKYSPETQLNACQTYAEQKHLIVHDVIKETGSAWKAKRRPKYLVMLDRIEREKIPHLIFYLPDRITRNLDEWIPLRDIDVRLHDAVKNDSFNPQDPRDYKKTRTFEHDVIYATESSDTTSRRVSDAWVTQTKRGRCPHRRPLGYIVGAPVQVGKKWETTTAQDPERAPIIRLLFQHVLTTGERNRSTLRRKAKDLGLRSVTGRVLGLQEVIDLFDNPFYCGRVTLKRKVVCEKGEQEPIISPEEFDEAQAILGGKRSISKGGKKGKYSDLLTCDYCGLGVILDEHVKKDKKTGEVRRVYKYYRCTGGKAEAFYQEQFHRPKCPLYYGPYYKEEDLDRLFEMAIGALYVDPDTYDWIRNELEEDYQNLKTLNEDEAASLEKEHKQNLLTQSFLAQRLAKANPAVIPSIEREIEHLEIRNGEITARLDQLKTGKQAVSLEEVHQVLELSKALKDNYLAASPEKRAKLNRLMFRTVRLARKDDLVNPVENDPALTMVPFYFEWNEPFKSLWEIGFIQGVAEAEAEWRERLAAQKPAENKGWRAWRDSNSRPAA